VNEKELKGNIEYKRQWRMLSIKRIRKSLGKKN